MRTTEHNHTPSSKARQPGRHKKQPDTQREGPAKKLGQDATKGPTAGGREATTGRGGEPTTAKQRTDTRRPNHPQKGARRPRKDTRKRTGRNTITTKTPPKRGHAREEAKHKTKDKRRQGEHSPNQDRTKPTYQTNKRGAKRGRNPTEARERPPPHSSKWEQIAMWCPGTEGTGDKTAKVRQQNEGRGEGRGGSLRQTPCSIFKVVLFICSRVSVQLFPIAKETGLVLSSPAAWSAVHCIWPERQPCQSLAFSYVIAYRGKPFLAHCCLSVASGT